MDAGIDSPGSTKSESESSSNVEIQRKSACDQILNNRKKSEMEVSQTSNSGDDSPMEGTSVVHTKLPPGKASIELWNNVERSEKRRKEKDFV